MDTGTGSPSEGGTQLEKPWGITQPVGPGQCHSPTFAFALSLKSRTPTRTLSPGPHRATSGTRNPLGHISSSAVGAAEQMENTKAEIQGGILQPAPRGGDPDTHPTVTLAPTHPPAAPLPHSSTPVYLSPCLVLPGQESGPCHLQLTQSEIPVPLTVTGVLLFIH